MQAGLLEISLDDSQQELTEQHSGSWILNPWASIYTNLSYLCVEN